MSARTHRPIALALSGGGVRAMVFHMGVLQRLAERGLLEDITRISSVSGGSLLVGLILAESSFCWPSSRQYLEQTYPVLQSKLCQRSLQWGAVRKLLSPANWRYVLSRANVLAAVLRTEWNIDVPLSALPATPEWSINGTNAGNGRRFRFKRDNFGDYMTGYAPGGKFPLANAMAVSAAFPGGFGPLALKTGKFTWKKRPSWDAAVGTEQVVVPNEKAIYLYDGGVYDNLGLEPFFDAGTGATKLAENDFILVSDAGAPLPAGFDLGALNPFRLKRVADIMADQSHALRIRTFINYLKTGTNRGNFLFIGNQAIGGTAETQKFASSFPTTLRRLTDKEFESISSHGYQIAAAIKIVSEDDSNDEPKASQ